MCRAVEKHGMDDAIMPRGKRADQVAHDRRLAEHRDRGGGMMLTRAGLTVALALCILAAPVPAGPQQPDRMRRIGVLMGLNENDPEATLWLSGFTQGLQELGWIDGGNVRLDVRWASGSSDRTRIFAKELVNLRPDVILSHGTPVTAALQQETRTIPIVFVTVADPVGHGYVANLSRPGGNLTGFVFTEGEMGGKWLELLTEVAPGIKRAAIMFNPDTAPHRGLFYLPSFEAAARSHKVEPITAPVHSDAEIETAITSLVRAPGSGLVVMGDPFMVVHRGPAIVLAVRNNLPAVYFHAVFARDGGLLSYGPDNRDIFRRAASYVDRILRGAKPAELPVQIPTKFELVINLRTAKTLGLTIPPVLLLRADQIIK
jgi:putative tryptophan/tyrosine transport system substrate-binding protein